MTPTGALLDYLSRRGLKLSSQYLRDALHTLAQVLMESEVSRMLDAAPYERIGSRRAYRNGYRERVWRTSAGDIALSIPKLRKGSYFPRFLNLQAESILRDLAQDAFVSGVTLAQVQAVLAALELESLLLSDAADVAERLADVAHNTHTRQMHSTYPALFLDVLDVQQDGFWRQILVVLGVRPSGQIDFLAHDIVSVADDRAWSLLLRRLRQRGLQDIEVIVSDDYRGVRIAVERELVSAVWQHHRNFLLRGSADDALVNAVSTLAVSAETDARDLPHMMLAAPSTTYDFAPIGQRFFVIA